MKMLITPVSGAIKALHPVQILDSLIYLPCVVACDVSC
jgi:hypothetical protein